MKILHVVAGLSRAGGGLSELVPAFAREMAVAGNTVTLVTVGTNDEPLSTATEKARSSGVRVVRCSPSFPRFLFFSFEMLLKMWPLVAQADVVHVHSNWTFPVWWTCFWALRLNKPLVMSPQGTLDPVRLAHSAWKKRLVGWVDRFFLKRGAAIHATSEMEQAWINQFVSCASEKIAIIPNGVDVDEKNEPNRQRKADLSSSRERVVLYLGRNHSLKGLDLLEEAWGRVKREGWRLSLVGPGLPGGLVEGKEKWSVLQSADIFVLPSRSENFGIVVAEALAVGVPVITTKGTPWTELVSERCGWWVDVGVEPLADALRKAMGVTDEERRIMGENGRRLVECKYQWKAVAKQMVELYEVACQRSVSDAKCDMIG